MDVFIQQTCYFYTRFFSKDSMSYVKHDLSYSSNSFSLLIIQALEILQ